MADIFASGCTGVNGNHGADRAGLTCDKALHRLVCYVGDRTLDWTLKLHVGDPPEALRARLFVGADFAGDRYSYSTASGAILVIE